MTFGEWKKLVLEQIKGGASGVTESRASGFAAQHKSPLGDGPLVMLTDEQADIEYGTPETDSSPWVLGALGGIDR